MTRSTLLAITFVVTLCVGSNSLANGEEQSVDQAIRVLRDVQVEKLAESDKEAKAVEVQQAWETLEKAGQNAVKSLHQAIKEDRQTSKKNDFFALGAAMLLWKINGIAEANEIAEVWQSARQTVNYNYVFATAVMAAKTRDPRVLPMLRALLHEKEGHFGVPQHAMTLAWPQSMEIVWGTFGSGGLDCLEDVLEHSKNPSEMETAMLLLTSAQQIKALPAIRRLAKHPNPELKCMAIQCLGVFGHSEDYETLTAGLKSDDKTYSVAYLAALWQYGDPRAAAIAAPYLNSTDATARQIALQALMGLPSPVSLNAIHKRADVASDVEEKKLCRLCVKQLTDFIGANWEKFNAMSPAEQQRLFDTARKKLEEEQFSLRPTDRKLTRAEFLQACEQWKREHRMSGDKYEWIELRHILPVAEPDDLPRILDVRSRLYERLSDECFSEIANLDALLFQLGRRRYRKDTGPLSIPYGWTPEPDGEMERAIAAIKKACGRTVVDENRPGKPIVEVRLTGVSVDDAILSRLKPLTDVETLDLEFAPITDRGLNCVRGMTKVRNLTLNWTKISDAGLASLEGMHQLRTLSLANTEVTDAGLVHLRELSDLQELSLSYTKVKDHGLAYLGGLQRLKTLNLDNALVSDAGLEAIGKLHALTVLSLNKGSIRGDGLANLQKLEQLESLSLAGTSLTDAGLANLPALPRLQELVLTDDPIAGDSLAHLAEMKSLRSLTLWCTKLTDAGMKNLARLTNLRDLNIGNTKITDDGLKHLEPLVHLQSLDLCLAMISDAGMKHLVGLPQLQKVNLDHTPLTDAGLEPIQKMQQLEQLNLGYTYITDAGLKHLRGMTRLHSLTLRECKITDSGLEHLTDIASLRSLTLSNCKITDAGLEALKGMKDLETLELDGTQITDTGLAALSGLVQLKHLTLAHSQISDAGLEHLKSLRRLKYLYLSDTNVTGDGRRKIAESLPGLSVW